MEGLKLKPGTPAPGDLTTREEDGELVDSYFSNLFKLNDSGLSIGVTK